MELLFDVREIDEVVLEVFSGVRGDALTCVCCSKPRSRSSSSGPRATRRAARYVEEAQASFAKRANSVDERGRARVVDMSAAAEESAFGRESSEGVFMSAMHSDSLLEC